MNETQTNTRETFPPQAVAHNVNELKHDLLTLLHLQWELLGADLKQCVAGLRTPIMLIVGAAGLALGAVFVLLLAIAAGLMALDWPLPLALAAAAFVALGAAAAMSSLAWSRFRGAMDVLARSREELRRNVESLKELFTHNGSPRGPLPR